MAFILCTRLHQLLSLSYKVNFYILNSIYFCVGNDVFRYARGDNYPLEYVPKNMKVEKIVWKSEYTPQVRQVRI